MRFLSVALFTSSFLGFAVCALFGRDANDGTTAPPGCGAYAGTKEEIAAAESHFQDLLKQSGNSTLARRASEIVQIPVYWNVFYDQNTGEGNIA